MNGMADGHSGQPRRISVDDQGNIRLLGAEEFDKTRVLSETCDEFVGST